ncbi:hypothetical protein [Erwinia sp. MYb416]|uniref:hypothetical protein n=1 Tax=Erwinia sp. MYb416 TaxID=3108532 RepID=UPI0030AB55D3
MEQKKGEIKPMAYRMRPEVKNFVEGNAKRTYRSAQGMMDYLMDKIMEMEKKGDFVI